MTSVSKGIKLNRLDEIEGLRGVGSVCVVLGHISSVWIPWMWMWMDVFFVVSGYLIGRIAMVSQGVPGFWRAYLARRVLRIWPLYYTVLLVCVLGALIESRWLGNPEAETPDLVMIRNLFFLQNTEFLLQPFAPVNPIIFSYLSYFVPSWSVAVEEQFYLIAPFLAWTLFNRVKKADQHWSAFILQLAGVILLFASLMRLAGINWGVLPGRLDGFMLGILLAALELRAGSDAVLASLLDRMVRPVFFLICAATLIFILSYYWPVRYFFPEAGNYAYELRHIFGVSLSSLMGTGLVAVCVFRKFSRFRQILIWPRLQLLGKISYSTYLWHVPILYLLSHFDWYQNGLPRGTHAPVALAIILSFSYLSYHVIELPAMNLKHRFRLDGKSARKPDSAAVTEVP